MTARIVAAAAAAVAAGAVLGVATLAAPAPGGSPGAGASVSIEPVRQPVVCPGPLEIPVGSITSGDEDLDSGSSDIDYQVSPGGQPLGAGTSVDESQAVSLERVATGDIAGLAGVGCTPPLQDQWLVGGSTALGSSARLVLTNPTASSVRARVQVHGPVGAGEEATSVLLGPQTQETLLLESIEPELPGIAVHVHAEGVGVAAVLQDSRLDGFTAAGTDWVAPSQPATSLVVPVVGPATADAPASLALLAPEGAEATLTLLTEDGPQPWLGDEALELEAGVLTDVQVPMTGLAAVRIESTAPVVAGARVLVARDAPLDDGSLAFDHAWTSAQDVQESRQRAVVVPDAATQLVVASDSAATFTAQAGGEAVSLEVEPGSVASAPLDLPPGTVVTSSDSASWVVLVTDQDAGFVTTIEPVVTDLDGREIAVSVGPYAPVP